MPAITEMVVDSDSEMPAQSESADHIWLLKLMEQDGDGVLRMLWRILGNEPDVLDAYQDCFCKMATTDRGRIRHAKAYLYRTASNIAVEYLRLRKKKQEHWPRIVQRSDLECEGATGHVVEDENLDGMRQAIEKLPAHLRNVLLLRDFGSKSYKEVAQILGIDAATARVYRRGAVVKLMELMKAGEGS